jgi:hypothetical protein
MTNEKQYDLIRYKEGWVGVIKLSGSQTPEVADYIYDFYANEIFKIGAVQKGQSKIYFAISNLNLLLPVITMPSEEDEMEASIKADIRVCLNDFGIIDESIVNDNYETGRSFSEVYHRGRLNGFKAAQRNFSEEDMRNAIELAFDAAIEYTQDECNDVLITDIISSFKKPKEVKAVVLEMYNDDCLKNECDGNCNECTHVNWKPKTFTNKQGKEEVIVKRWVW